MSGLVRDEVFPGMLGCFEEFGGYATSDHLDVLLEPEFEFEVVLLRQASAISME